ncbi:hypothetical protein SH591_13210 [Sphingomonas sp. LY54]|uniref:hypothetical protein n=1 Tax=Sphingomonas sp. LY54 TaxID=3095343 RepID=UPI002D796143|nr:hypothetical protein [Sphingomonas sp. LY54]WRP28054.1 hypothetical protein SH591_13210 [Sphingomonas sp. LY54]
MITQGFKPVGWVAAVASAALGCYMLSLNVASERAELASLERRIIATKREIRTLQTELGTRGRLAQLDQWNADVLALSAPTSSQFLEDEFMLARFDRHDKTVAERAPVQMAAMEAPKPAERPAVKMAAAEIEDSREARPMIQRAAYVPTDDRPFKPIKAAASAPTPAPVKLAAAKPAKAAPVAEKKSGLLDDRLIAEIGVAARSERKSAGTGGQ